MLTPRIYFFYIFPEKQFNIFSVMENKGLNCLFTVGLLSTNCSTAPSYDLTLHDTIIPADSAIVFNGITLITMEEKGVQSGRTVIIRNGRIDRIGERGSLSISSDSMVLEADGYYVIRRPAVIWSVITGWSGKPIFPIPLLFRKRGGWWTACTRWQRRYCKDEKPSKPFNSRKIPNRIMWTFIPMNGHI